MKVSPGAYVSLRLVKLNNTHGQGVKRTLAIESSQYLWLSISKREKKPHWIHI